MGGDPLLAISVRAPSLHGFGVRYDLPISLALYLYAAAGVVVVSFVMVAVFLGDRVGDRAITYPRREVGWLTQIGRTRAPRLVGGIVGVLALAAIVATGLFGSQEPTRSPAEYLTWVYFWAALVILCGLVGNLWTLVNPWAAIYDVALGRWRPRPVRALPDWLGIWPAVVGYFLFAAFELASGVANRPWLVATLAILYSVITLAGMAVFGRNEWLNRAEGFTFLFGLVGRFGPVHAERDGNGRVRRVLVRPWGVGLLDPIRTGWDTVTFVILTLSTLAFDGLIATPAWQQFQGDLSVQLMPLGTVEQPVIRVLGMLLLSTAFLLVFTAFTRLVIFFGTRKVDELETITAFATTLIPIALVYNAAHNYTYLVVQSQGLVPLLADPFARGWHLVPTAGYRPSFALATAAMVWYIQVVLIVLGHVVAVYLAHLRAGERFRTAQRALLSQYPMLVLMVLYTMTSLWILAQPITREG
jgi:hypothetical protein